MNLSFEQIRAAACGAAYCEQSEIGVHFHRFTCEQETLYHAAEPRFDKKLTATAGVSLRFFTDSRLLTLGVTVFEGSTRTYFAHDVLINGIYLGSLQNFAEGDLEPGNPQKPFPLGDFEKTFDLGEGEKEVTVLLPALVSSVLTKLTLEDGASFIPAPKRPVWLAVGDSISQGYDAAHPRCRYTARVAAALGMDEHNLAIGGEIFNPTVGHTLCEEGISLVTIAYGSNDWKRCGYEEAVATTEDFFAAAAEALTHIPVYVITPIWRKDCVTPSAFGPFARVGDTIRAICSQYPNFTVIDGFDFVPHDTALFADGSLHPNDEGFTHYAKQLLAILHAKENENA